MSFGFGIVGLGMIAGFQAQAIEALEGGRLVACCSRSKAKADVFASDHGGRAYREIDSFLADPELDIVCICTPSGAHLEPALRAAQAGRHLVVEKPLEITLERCDRIIEACAKHGVTCAGVFPSRFSEAAGLVKKAVEAGRFGRLTVADARVKWFRSQEYYDKGGWRGTWRYDGGGALMNQSIHAVDLLGWFMGPVAEVQAFAGTLGHERIEVEDTAVAALRYESGAMGVIEGSTAVYPGFPKRIEISGTEGSAVLVEDALEKWEFLRAGEEDPRIRERYAAPSASGGAAAAADISFEGHRRQFADLVHALETGGKPRVDGVEARKAVEIILAVYESAESGTSVRLAR